MNPGVSRYRRIKFCGFFVSEIAKRSALCCRDAYVGNLSVYKALWNWNLVENRAYEESFNVFR